MIEGHGEGGLSTVSDTELRELVMGYLDEHPTAMDTLDGIAEWWIFRRQIEIEVRRVSKVLGALVLDGELEEFEQGGVRFFRRPGPLRRGSVIGVAPGDAP
jgi:hypothetical protein